MEPTTAVGHGIIGAMLAYIIRLLHKIGGIKFDFRVWRNGGKKSDK